MNILQAIAGKSLNLSGLPRDFENQLTTERPGPLCSFKKCKQWIYFPNCDAENRALTSHSSLPSILSCTSSFLKSHFMSTPTTSPQQQLGLLHLRQQIYKFCMASKSLVHQGFLRLKSISFLAEGHKTLILNRRDGAP